MPSTIGSVLVLIGFVIPGFITAWLWTLSYPRLEPSEGRLVLEGLALSCVNYGVWSWLLVLAWKLAWYERLVPSIVIVAFVLFVSPVFLGIVLVRVSESDWLRELRPRIGLASPVPRAWDHFFRKSGPCWVLATLKNGQVVGGLYGPIRQPRRIRRMRSYIWKRYVNFRRQERWIESSQTARVL